LVSAVLERKKASPAATLAGVLWLHGEIECRETQEETAGYATALEELVRALRSDLGMPSLPFVMLMPRNVSGIQRVLPSFEQGIGDLEGRLGFFKPMRQPGFSPFEVYGDRFPLNASPFGEDADQVHNHYTAVGQRRIGELFATAHMAQPTRGSRKHQAKALSLTTASTAAG